MTVPNSDEPNRDDQSSGRFLRKIAKSLQSTGQKLQSQPAEQEPFGNVILPNFPNLFGRSRHRPTSIELLRWNEPLSPKYELGRTVDHGRAWSISVDDSLRGCHLPVR
jgi:hypothetical protein